MNNLANSYEDAGRTQEAIKLYEETLRLRKAKLGPDHPHTLISMNNLARAYLGASQPNKARPLFKNLLDGQRSKLGAEDPRFAGLLATVASDLLKYGQAADAEPILRDCLAIREKKEPDAWTTFNTKSMLGEALVGQKQYAAAEPLLVQGYEGMKQREAK